MTNAVVEWLNEQQTAVELLPDIVNIDSNSFDKAELIGLIDCVCFLIIMAYSSDTISVETW